MGMKYTFMIYIFLFLSHKNVLIIKVIKNREDLDNIINKLDQMGYM